MADNKIPNSTTYEVLYSTGPDKIAICRVNIIEGYSTLEDTPKIIATLLGIDADDVVVLAVKPE